MVGIVGTPETEGPETKDQTVLTTVPGGVSVADVPVGALVDVGKVIALSGPALATGGIGTPQIASGVPAGQTVTSLHGVEQLLFSLDSVIYPIPSVSVSAQNLTEYIPAEENV
jgi:hypothetical protein